MSDVQRQDCEGKGALISWPSKVGAERSAERASSWKRSGKNRCADHTGIAVHGPPRGVRNGCDGLLGTILRFDAMFQRIWRIR